MPKMNLSHFEAACLFALFTSVVLGIITKRTDREVKEIKHLTFSSSSHSRRRDLRKSLMGY